MSLEPIMLGWIAACDADMRDLLRRSVEAALAAIEHPKSASRKVRRSSEFVLCVGTPEDSVTLLVQDLWPTRNPKLADVMTWRDPWQAFHRQRFPVLPSMLAALMDADIAAEIKTDIPAAHAQGNVPMVVALMASLKDRHCGVVGYLPLPTPAATRH